MRQLQTGSRPRRRAAAAASPRFATPSLARMFETCTLAVLAEMNNASAIWRLVRPSATEREHVELASGESVTLGGRRRDVVGNVDVEPGPTARGARPRRAGRPSRSRSRARTRRAPRDRPRRGRRHARRPPRRAARRRRSAASCRPSTTRPRPAPTGSAVSLPSARATSAAAWARIISMSPGRAPPHRSSTSQPASASLRARTPATASARTAVVGRCDRERSARGHALRHDVDADVGAHRQIFDRLRNRVDRELQRAGEVALPAGDRDLHPFPYEMVVHVARTSEELREPRRFNAGEVELAAADGEDQPLRDTTRHSSKPIGSIASTSRSCSSYSSHRPSTHSDSHRVQAEEHAERPVESVGSAPGRHRPAKVAALLRCAPGSATRRPRSSRPGRRRPTTAFRVRVPAPDESGPVPLRCGPSRRASCRASCGRGPRSPDRRPAARRGSPPRTRRSRRRSHRQHQLLTEGREHLGPLHARFVGNEPHRLVAVGEDLGPRPAQHPQVAAAPLVEQSGGHGIVVGIDLGQSARARSRARGRCYPPSRPASPRTASRRCDAFRCALRRREPATRARAPVRRARAPRRTRTCSRRRGPRRTPTPARASRSVPRPSGTPARPTSCAGPPSNHSGCSASSSATRVCSATRSPGRRSSSTASCTSAWRNRYSSPSPSETRDLLGDRFAHPVEQAFFAEIGDRGEETVIDGSADHGAQRAAPVARLPTGRRPARARCRARSGRAYGR